jgi:hypothetical protein
MTTMRPMILDRHPDIPDPPDPDQLRDDPTIDWEWSRIRGLPAIGYWANQSHPDLPDPHDFVDPSWDASERATVIAYLRTGELAIGYRGSSWCRFMCGDFEKYKANVVAEGYRLDDIPDYMEKIVKANTKNMGSTCRSDGTFVWPEGFAHYLEEHAVRPPQEFIQHALDGARRLGIG